jgi:hypothetical protein
MGYEFDRFSSQSFERFIQSLSVAVVGPRVQIYGRGKDGAREATFRGKCCVTDSEWDGYVVIQAKFKEMIQGSAENAKWLIKQINQ